MAEWRVVRFLSLASATVGVGLIFLAIATVLSGWHPTLPISSEAHASTNMTTAEVQRLAEEVVDAKIAETIGRDHVIVAEDGTQQRVEAISIDRSALTTAQLELRTLAVQRDITELSVAGHETTFPEPTDIWIAQWRREGVAVPDWDGPGTIDAVVLIEDQTKKVLQVSVGVVNPSAELASAERQTGEVCSTPPGLLPGGRLCYGAD
ncbi:MAG: hypothetical protein ACM3S1_00230 [Hyphomicrobiales bacterium]